MVDLPSLVADRAPRTAHRTPTAHRHHHPGGVADFDAEAFEVTLDNERAWEMRVYGNHAARYNRSNSEADDPMANLMGW